MKYIIKVRKETPRQLKVGDKIWIKTLEQFEKEFEKNSYWSFFCKSNNWSELRFTTAMFKYIWKELEIEYLDRDWDYIANWSCYSNDMIDFSKTK